MPLLSARPKARMKSCAMAAPIVSKGIVPVDAPCRSQRGPDRRRSGTADRFLNRHVASANISTGKRMPAHVEEMKQEDGEAEAVMIRGPNKPAKRAPVKLWGCEQGHTDIAGEDVVPLPIWNESQSISISPICSDEQITMIHVSQDMPLLMNDCEGLRDIGCNMRQEPEIYLWKSFCSALRL